MIKWDLERIQEGEEHKKRVHDANMIHDWMEQAYMKRAAIKSRYGARKAALNAELKVEFSVAREKREKKMVKGLKNDKERVWDQRSIDAALTALEYPGPPSPFGRRINSKIKAEDVE